MKTASRDGTRVQFWVKDDEYQQLVSLASAKNRTMSEFLRELIYKQLGIDGANDGLDVIRRIIHDEIKIQLKVQIERIIKIIIKVAMIEVSSFYYEKALLKLTNPALEEELRDTAEKSAAAYLGVKNNRAAEAVYNDFLENYSIDYDDYKDGDDI